MTASSLQRPACACPLQALALATLPLLALPLLPALAQALAHLPSLPPLARSLALALALALLTLPLLLCLAGLLRRALLLRRLPGPPQRLVLGNLASLQPMTSSHLQISKWSQDYGPVFVMRLVHMNLVVISHPETVSKLMRHGPYLAPKSPLAYHAFDLLTSPHVPNILTSPTDNDYYRAVRKTTAPAFNSHNLK